MFKYRIGAVKQGCICWWIPQASSSWVKASGSAKNMDLSDMYGDGLFYHAVETDYFSNRGDQLGLDYRYDSVKDINSISGSIWYLLPYNFAAGYSLERAIETEVTIEEKIRLIYQPACWSVELSSNYTPDDQIFMVTFRLANIGSPFGIDLPGGN